MMYKVVCKLLQVHEWGGVFTDIVTYSHFRQFRPGLRISINSHGGHYWSTQVIIQLLSGHRAFANHSKGKIIR